MRRLSGLVLASLLMLAMLVAPAAAAAGDASSDTVVLAVEDGDPLGPEPQGRLDEDNRARELAGYEDPETPFTWGAAWLLTFASLLGLALMGGLYYLLVHRPAQEGAESR